MKNDATLSFSRDPKELDRALFLDQRLIGIDGDPGAGKSTLAKEIRELVGGTIIALDDFLCVPGQPYLSQYKASDLAEHFRRSHPIPKIIEGVVLLDALDFLDTNADGICFPSPQILRLPH
jgi:hypothetical protein